LAPTWPTVGVHAKTPVALPIEAPAGKPASKENVNPFAGTSASVAVAVNVTATPAVVVLFPMGATTGATLTSFTVTMMVSAALNGGSPLSVARIVMGKEPGPSVSVGVHENAPLRALMVAPAGAPGSRENAIVSPKSGSVAVAVRASVASSSTVLFPTGSSVGGDAAKAREARKSAARRQVIAVM
jgi:hypothetical protein